MTSGRHRIDFGAGFRRVSDGVDVDVVGLLEGEKSREEKILSCDLVCEVVKDFQVIVGTRSQVGTKWTNEARPLSFRRAHFERQNLLISITGEKSFFHTLSGQIQRSLTHGIVTCKLS